MVSTEPTQPDSRATECEDEWRILEMLVTRTQALVDGQFRDSDAIDSKALGVAAVDAGAIAVLIAARHELSHLWWISAAVLAVAGAILLWAVWPRSFDAGPDPRAFYEQFGGVDRASAGRQMLAELLAARERNDRFQPRKVALFKLGLGLVVLALVGSVPIALTS